MNKSNNNDPYGFTDQLDEASWDMLEDHHKRGALFLVDQQLDIVTVATAIARDDLGQVKVWLDADQVSKPSDEQVELWKETPKKKVVQFLIVQPYVIVQSLEKTLH